MDSIETVDDNGDVYWKSPGGNWHREDGPAVIWGDGYRGWFIDGKRHREDGPARTWADGGMQWWLCDLQYGFNHYCRILRSTYGKTDEDIMLLRMQYETK